MKPRIKSKTHWTAGLIIVLGYLETNLHMVKDLLGDYYGLSFIVIGVIMAVLREVTHESVRKA